MSNRNASINKKIEKVTIHSDGGSRGNPGPGAGGWFLKDESGNLIDFGGKYLGEVTNNIAEYEALLDSLKNLSKNFSPNEESISVDIFLDSELIVKQINGEYKVKDQNLKRKFDMVMKALNSYNNYKVQHIARSENQQADKLVNIILDSRDVNEKNKT